MRKGSLFAWYLIAALFLFGAPTGLFIVYDQLRVVQLNTMQGKIIWADKQKEINLINQQIIEKLNKISDITSQVSETSILSKYTPLTADQMIKNQSYSNNKIRDKIKAQFLKIASKMNVQAALLFRNGKIVAANGKFDESKLAGNTKFLQSIASKKIISDVRFSEGVAEYFIPVIDAKDQLVSVIYAVENIDHVSDSVRKEVQSPRGYNFIVNMTGTVLLSTDKTKENTENIQDNKDIKSILSDSIEDVNVREANYNSVTGLFGYKKNKDMGYIACIFTPYSDYKSIQTDSSKKYTPALMDTRFVLPAYSLLALAFLAGLIILFYVSSTPFAPLSRITKALTHIDEDSFETMLPKIKSGPYKKMLDSLMILKGRIKASEEKAEKLSQMSKELEEELSKEASRADMEVSELRDALKIADNSKQSFEEEIIKYKNEAVKNKKDADLIAETVKKEMNQKLEDVEKEKTALKDEIKKAGDSKIPVEKENMRTEAVLMMNTELKGVLSVIKTYISSVLGGEGKITDAQQQFLGVVINKSARLERLINDLTELARLEKGEIKLNHTPIDLNNILQDIAISIQPQADVKKVDLKINYAPTIPFGIGDSARLSNVVTQILTQSIKVSPRGGQVIVETKEDENRAYIRLTDLGMSMPKAKADTLFINFHGPESPAGPEFINSGLRFPILKAVISNMEGEIWIESEIGKGKTFVIALPKEKKSGGNTAPVRENPFGAEQFKATQTSGIFVQQHPQAEVQIDMDRPKIVNSLSSISAGIGSEQKEGAAAGEQAKLAFKIQGNKISDWNSGKAEEVPKVSEVLSMEKPQGPKVQLPGADTIVPPEFFGAGQKEIANIPEELPPLPDLMDDKGTDII